MRERNGYIDIIQQSTKRKKRCLSHASSSLFVANRKFLRPALLTEPVFVSSSFNLIIGKSLVAVSEILNSSPFRKIRFP